MVTKMLKLRKCRSCVDNRDHLYNPRLYKTSDRVDLREWATVVEDQEELGGCTGNAITSAYELMVKKQYPEKSTQLSRLFVYYNGRMLEGTVDEDLGATLRNSLRAVKEFGICAESLWPYDISKFNIKPSDEAYLDAKQRTIKNYRLLSSIEYLFDALDQGIPVVVGMEVYEEFFSVNKENNVIDVPKDIGNPQGEHAVCAVGYDKPNRMVLIKNSFGSNWGDQGYAWITLDYTKFFVYEMWIFDIDDRSQVENFA